jgi:ribosomal protein S18 acetylase RimI-like enzyme
MERQKDGQMRIVRAGTEELEDAARLFDAYRQFYKRPADLEAARRFLAARLSQGDSVFYLAYPPGDGARAVGFVHLYPSFDSLAMKPLWILYDLYVAPQARRLGVAEALMERAARLGRETGASSLILETANDNQAAQALYEKLGYVKDEVFYRYALALPA